MPRNARLYLVAEAVSALATGAFGVVYNLYVLALGFDTGFLGTLLTAAGAGAGAGALVGGPLVDRYGARGVLLGSSVLTAAGVATQLLLTSGPALLGGSMVAGFGAAAYYVAASPFLARNLGDAPRDDLFSFDTAVVLGATALGAGLGGLAATYLSDTLGDPRAAYAVTLWGAAAAGACSFPALVLTRERDESLGSAAPSLDGGQDTGADNAAFSEVKRGGAVTAGWRDVLRSAAVWKLSVVAALIGLGAGLFTPYLNVFFVEELGATPGLYGGLSAAATGSRLVATLLAPPLAQRVGTAQAVGFTQLASVPLLLLLGFGPTLPIAGAAFLVRGALMNMAAPLQTSFRMAIIPAALLGSGNSAIWIADSAARAASTFAGGMLISRTGYRLPYLATAVCYVASATIFLYWFARPTPTHKEAGASPPPLP
jgi:MFS family permease